jgi:hypothetical protein
MAEEELQDVFVEIEADDEELVYDDESSNLVNDFSATPRGLESLREISAIVCDSYETEWDNSEEHRNKKADEWRMFSGELPEKSFPWKNSANAHVPIALENITRLSFRTEAELFGDWTNVFGVDPVGPEDSDVASVLSRHGNWQISQQIIDFPRQQSRGILMFYLNGDVVCESYWDPHRRQNRHVMLTIDEFVTPYTYVSTMPDFSDCPFVIRIRRMQKHELEAKRGIWYGVDEVIAMEPPAWDQDPEAKLREAEADIQGKTVPDAVSSAPYVILQYEGWLDLPGQERQRYCQVILDKDTEAVLFLGIHEEEDWRDRQRFERQTAELEEYRRVKDEYDSISRNIMMQETELQNNKFFTTEEKLELSRNIDRAELPPPPQPPGWIGEGDPNDPMEGPDPVKKQPIHMFSHGVCIETLTGCNGLGFGRIESDFNKAANTALSQFIDAATLANCKSLIKTNMLEFDRPFDAAPGSVHNVSGVSGHELKNNIMPLEFGPANPQLMEVVDKMYGWGQSAIQAPSVLSGEAGKSGETFRGLATRVEQATKQLSVATRHYSNFLTQILKNNARLNSIFLDDEEIIMVNDHKLNTVEELRLGRAMYRRDYRVTYKSDLKFTSEAAKIAEADQLLQMGMQLPVLAQDIPFWYQAIKNSLEARGQDGIAPYLGPEPPPPQNTFGINPVQPPMSGQEGQPNKQPPAGVPGPGGQPPE